MERRLARNLAIPVLLTLPNIHTYTVIMTLVLVVVLYPLFVKLAEYDKQAGAIFFRYVTYDRVYDPEAPLRSRRSFSRWLLGSPLAGPARPAVPTPTEIKGAWYRV